MEIKPKKPFSAGNPPFSGILRKNTFAGFACAALLIFAPAAAHPRESPVRFAGELYTDLGAVVPAPFAGKSGGWQDTGYTGRTVFRLDMTGGDREYAKVEASGLLSLHYGESAGTVRAAGTEGAAVSFGENGPVLTGELKKLYLSVYTEYADISAGRMIINYGRGTVFSPVDLFAAVDISDLVLGRAGTDAARVLIPLGMLSGIDMVSTIAETPRRMTAGARVYGNLTGWDFGFSAFRDGRSAGDDGALALGLDLKGDAAAGISAEVLVRLPWDNGVSANNMVWSLMAGLDYSIRGTWLFDLEYLANIGPGKYRTGSFRGDHNLFVSLSWKIDDITALDSRGIVNITEGAWQGTVSFSRNIARGTAVTAYALYRNGNVEGDPGSPGPEALGGGLRLSVAF